ncbi:hypothetical protein EC957_006460 [Mortierella hygrophila]|uniref:Uncharacterized protein n=1 Tax=Mortierella hygrophila TaxID=979708 RepID=A0A9P6EZB7_9FUNG|nr:hypothetical protein EC957_006460 [Mortierella hygrophila]
MIETKSLFDSKTDGVGATYDFKGIILPVHPESTLLTRIDITLDEIFNPELLFGILNALPDLVLILEVDYENYFDGDWKQSRVEEPWKPNKLKRICLCGADESANEDLYLIPLTKASLELQALRIPSISSDHDDSFMETLGESCPKLRYLVLNKHKVGVARQPCLSISISLSRCSGSISPRIGTRAV